MGSKGTPHKYRRGKESRRWKLVEEKRPRTKSDPFVHRPVKYITPRQGKSFRSCRCPSGLFTGAVEKDVRSAAFYIRPQSFAYEEIGSIVLRSPQAAECHSREWLWRIRWRRLWPRRGRNGKGKKKKNYTGTRPASRFWINRRRDQLVFSASLGSKIVQSEKCGSKVNATATASPFEQQTFPSAPRSSLIAN